MALTPLLTLLARLGDGLDGSGDCEVTIDADGDPALPPSVHVAFYCVAQEALNNVRKYARAAHAWVMVRRVGDGFQLTVRDDGIGFDRPGVSPGMGQSIMKERADGIGAQLAIDSAPGCGTTDTLVWPASGRESG